MITLLIFLFILGILITVHEFGHFIAAKKAGVKVEEFSLGFGRPLFIRKKNGTQYTIRAIPLGGFVKMSGDNLEEYKGETGEYFSKPVGRRAQIIFAGPLLNYILGFLFFWLVFIVGYPALTTKVGGLLDGFGAKDAGVQVGDTVIAVDGQKVSLWEDLLQIIHAKKEAATVHLLILRGNKEYALDVVIKQKEIDDLVGEKQNVGLLGITPQYAETVTVRHGVWKSLLLSVEQTWDLTVLTYKAIWRMVTAKLSIRAATGPLGIFVMTSHAAHAGIIALLDLIARISISLAIFNLLPLPILDGGHILLLGIEKIRGKYISVKTEQMIARVGLTLILSLALVVTYNDVVRFFGDKIAKFFVK